MNSDRNVAVGVTDEPASRPTWTESIAAAQEVGLAESGSASAAAPRISPILRPRMLRFLAR